MQNQWSFGDTFVQAMTEARKLKQQQNQFNQDLAFRQNQLGLLDRFRNNQLQQTTDYNKDYLGYLTSTNARNIRDDYVDSEFLPKGLIDKVPNVNGSDLMKQYGDNGGQYFDENKKYIRSSLLGNLSGSGGSGKSSSGKTEKRVNTKTGETELWQDTGNGHYVPVTTSDGKPFITKGAENTSSISGDLSSLITKYKNFAGLEEQSLDLDKNPDTDDVKGFKWLNPKDPSKAALLSQSDHQTLMSNLKAEMKPLVKQLKSKQHIQKAYDGLVSYLKEGVDVNKAVKQLISDNPNLNEDDKDALTTLAEYEVIDNYQNYQSFAEF